MGGRTISLGMTLDKEDLSMVIETTTGRWKIAGSDPIVAKGDDVIGFEIKRSPNIPGDHEIAIYEKGGAIHRLSSYDLEITIRTSK